MKKFGPSVKMATRDFEKLTGRRTDPRHAFRVRDMPPEDADLLIAGLAPHILDADRD